MMPNRRGAPPIFALIAVLLASAVLAAETASGADSRLAAQFRNADADGDGKLSRAEAGRAAPGWAARFDAIDADRDGKISPEEIRASRRAGKDGRKSAVATKFDQLFDRADADGDGILSQGEAQTGLPRVATKFDRIDKNGDGRLTREEMRAWLAAKRAARTAK